MGKLSSVTSSRLKRAWLVILLPLSMVCFFKAYESNQSIKYSQERINHFLMLFDKDGNDPKYTPQEQLDLMNSYMKSQVVEEDINRKAKKDFEYYLFAGIILLIFPLLAKWISQVARWLWKGSQLT